jgi:hypothetical protein
MSVASRVSPTQVVRWFSKGKRRLLNWDMRGVLSALSFTGSGVCYFDQVWLWKAMDIEEVSRRDVNQRRGDLLPEVSSLILAMVGQPHHIYYTNYSACPIGKY